MLPAPTGRIFHCRGWNCVVEPRGGPAGVFLLFSYCRPDGAKHEAHGMRVVRAIASTAALLQALLVG